MDCRELCLFVEWGDGLKVTKPRAAIKGLCFGRGEVLNERVTCNAVKW